ncbi:MAG: ATPase, partial [Phototrophicales bacterium]
ILDRSKYILINGENVLLTSTYKAQIKESNKELAGQALRVLALAYRAMDSNESVDETTEKDLVFVGLVGMMDPPRPEVKDAIAKCRTAGIQIVMITGDQKETGFAIARELGLADNDAQVITGKDIERMNDEVLTN